MSSPVEIAFIGAGGIAVGAILSGLEVAAAQAWRDRKLERRTRRVAMHLIENDLETKLFALEALAAKGRVMRLPWTTVAAARLGQTRGNHRRSR